MTTRLEKIDELVDDLNKAPSEVIESRLNSIKEIELFEDTFRHLCAPLYNDYGSGQNLHDVSLQLSKIRANCLGADSSDVLYYDLQSSSSYSSLTDFSFPSLDSGTNSKPKFAILIKDIDNTYSISLNNTSGSTETSIESDGTSNTYSNYVGDYYFVRSRETGNLLDFTSNNTAFVNPSFTMPFGNTVSFGDSIENEEGNWNELFAYANIGSVEYNSTSDQFLTLAHDLDQGFSGIETKVPSPGQTLGLKNFNPIYQNITITGNTIIDLLSNSASDRISTSNSNLINVGSELSHPDWSSNLIVTAVNTDDNVIMLNANLDLVFTDTEIEVKNLITEAHSLFALAQVVTEGMQPNPDWKSTGDNDADYSSINESPEESTSMDNNSFDSRLGVFISPYNNLILFESASPDILSSGNESGQHTGNYPNVDLNTFKPAIEGARNEYGTDTGAQPQSLGLNDIFAGRFVKYDENRQNNSGSQIGDYRYMVDAASKFFYLPNPLKQVHSLVETSSITHANGTVETTSTTFQISPTTIPNTLAGGRGIEPLAKYADGRTTILTTAIENVRSDLNTVINSSTPLSVSSTSGYAQNARHPNNGTVPSGFPYSWGNTSAPVGNTHVYTNSSGSSANPATATILYLNSDDKIETHQFNHNVFPNINSETGQIQNYTHELEYLISETSCRYNDLRNNVYSTSDYQYVKSKIGDLDSLASYRDPIMEVSGGPEYSSSKKSAAEEFDNSIGNCDLDFNDVDGDATQYNTSNYDGATFSISNIQDLYSSLSTAKTSIENRIIELNARIGDPTYTGSQSSGGSLPNIRVSAIPAKSATSLAPYGRTLYEIVNLCLGNDINLISNVIDGIDSISFRYKSIRDNRNQYDILNGRGKYYGS